MAMKVARTTALLIAATALSPAMAQDDADEAINDFDLSSTVSIVSDYRFRGISLSNRNPAAQASVDVEHKSGVYAGVWASNIARYGGAKVEVDLYAGWRRSLGPVDLDVGATAYLYPSGRNVNYVEVYGFIGKTIGPAELKGGLIYTPSQANIGGSDNLYLTSKARVGLPGTPVTVTGGVGFEDGPLAGLDGDKWDWSLGGEYSLSAVTFGLQYTDTDVREVHDPDRTGRAGVVASASIEF
jgi:uncharacterized protein (TIGR02001 family)